MVENASSAMENETYRFIGLIEKHPQLYNKKHKDFLRQDIRNTIWDNICKDMNWDGELDRQNVTTWNTEITHSSSSFLLIEMSQTPTRQRRNGVIYAINS